MQPKPPLGQNTNQPKRKKIMSNNRAIAQLKKAADTLGQLAETLRSVSAAMEPKKEVPAEVKTEKKTDRKSVV